MTSAQTYRNGVCAGTAPPGSAYWGTGAGGVVGPGSAVPGTLATYANSSGNLLSTSSGITAVAGDLEGVTLINGSAVVVGPGSAIPGTVTTYGNAAGNQLATGSLITAIGGDLEGVTILNGAPAPSSGFIEDHWLTDEGWSTIPDNNYMYYGSAGNSVFCSYATDLAAIVPAAIAEATFQLPIARATPFTDIVQCSGCVVMQGGAPIPGIIQAVIGSTNQAMLTVNSAIAVTGAIYGSFVYSLV